MPPSLKPTRHFRELAGDGELFARLIQCRTGHCYQGAYYSSMNIEEQYDCPCGEGLQTREHTLRTCPRYKAHRDTLRRVSRSIDLGTILGMYRGIWPWLTS